MKFQMRDKDQLIKNVEILRKWNVDFIWIKESLFIAIERKRIKKLKHKIPLNDRLSLSPQLFASIAGK